MESVLQYLESIHPINDDCKERLLSILRMKELSKKDFLLRAGHICQYIYFVQKGLLRCFYYKNDVEISSRFVKEKNAVLSVESFFQQTPSYESIQALEDAELYYLGYKDLRENYRVFPELNYIARVLTEKYCCHCEQKLYAIRMMRASERYQYLLDNDPELIERVPAKFIASYIGITPEMLSKIKADKNNF